MEQLRSLADLLDLQDVDSDIDRLLNQRQSMPELEQYRVAAEKANRLAAELDEAQALLKGTTRALDRAEGELVLHHEKREIEERRLYAGGFGARETDHLRQEVEMLGRQASDMEDQLLEIMEAKEDQEVRAAELMESLAAARAEQERLEVIVADLWRGIDGKIARKEERKTAVVKLIEPELLELYEEIRPLKEGVAVGRLAEGICGGCHLRLSAAEQVQVKKDDPPRCLHCLRILVPQ